MCDWQELSEPGFAGLVDFQDWGLVYRMFFAMKKLIFLIGSLERQTHNPGNLIILKIMVQTIPANPHANHL